MAVILNNILVGSIEEDSRGRYHLTYDQSWRDNANAYPLSLALPLVAGMHADTSDYAPVRSFLDGLLPDNVRIRDQWSRQYHVPADSPFALLTVVGEDCAGAVQFAPPERVSALLASRTRQVEWITEADVARRLRDVRTGAGPGRQLGDPGQFSLPGAQPKLALLFEDGRWGVPGGRTPTSHILKPPAGTYPGFAENELVCLTVARGLGLPVPESTIARFADTEGEEIAFVTERYDRLREGSRLVRVHQEDCCQALGIAPARKYEVDGGPGVAAISDLLRAHSTQAAADLTTFLTALVLNWVLVGTDAHAKNYSVLHAAGGAVRLAPIYDLLSGLPYPSIWDPTATSTRKQARLAMRIGGESRIYRIRRRNWEACSDEIGIDRDAALARVEDIVGAFPDVVADACRRLKEGGIDDPVLDQLAAGAVARAAQCALLLSAKR